MRRLVVVGCLALATGLWPGAAGAQTSDPFQPKQGTKASSAPSSTSANDPFLPSNARPSESTGGGGSASSSSANEGNDPTSPGGGSQNESSQSGSSQEGSSQNASSEDGTGSGNSAAEETQTDGGAESLPVTGAGPVSWLVIAYMLIAAGLAALGYVALTRRPRTPSA